MKIRNSYHFYASVTIVFWSMAYVLTRITLQYFSAFSLGFIRCFIASCVLLPVVLRIKIKLPRRADLPWIIAAGCTGFFLYIILFNTGQAMVTSSTASVVIATVPVITALLARVFYRESLRVWQWAAIAVEFIGVAVLTILGEELSFNAGVFWLLAASLCLSAYNLIQRRLIRAHSPLQATAYSIFIGMILLSVFAPKAVEQTAAAPPVQYVYLAVLGIFSSAVAYIAWSKALSLATHTSYVSNYMFITPFFASIFGFLIAGEVPDHATLIGGGIILLGVFLYNFGGRMLSSPHSRNTGG